MAFHTNIFRGGEWVTERVDLHAVLKSQTAPKPQTRHAPLKPPQCGLLTRTVVESARTNSILPVRLRSSESNDVAFVGVSLHCSSPVAEYCLILTFTRTTLSRYASFARTAV